MYGTLTLLLFSASPPPPPTLQRDPMTSLMPRPWMPFGTEPSASTSPPTLKVWAMATVLSFTVRYVLSECLVVFLVSFSILMGLHTTGEGGGSERAGFLLYMLSSSSCPALIGLLLCLLKTGRVERLNQTRRKGNTCKILSLF